jgi:drug/metabolite transporter (DMT)-like permease
MIWEKRGFQFSILLILAFIPIFAIMWGLLDHEKITGLHLVCMGLILGGVYLMQI